MIKESKKKKLPSLKTLSNKCDDLLTPIIKLMYPRCILCGNKTQVAHHHYHSSKSLRLRYYLPNLIPLCNGCHFKLHQNESYWACQILVLNGLNWFLGIDAVKDEKVVPNRQYFIGNYSRLLDTYTELST